MSHENVFLVPKVGIYCTQSSGTRYLKKIQNTRGRRAVGAELKARAPCRAIAATLGCETAASRRWRSIEAISQN